MFTVAYTITAIFEKLGLSSPPVESPSSILLASKLPSWVFGEDDGEREMFENLFNVYDNDVIINYFPNLGRARITFSDLESAMVCKKELHGLELDGSTRINLSYVYLGRSDMQQLDVPPPTRQFLISPPSSPPVGWEPITEMEPHVDETLLAAIEKLGGQNLSGEELMLIPQEEEKPAVTLKMSKSEFDKENTENVSSQNVRS